MLSIREMVVCCRQWAAASTDAIADLMAAEEEGGSWKRRVEVIRLQRRRFVNRADFPNVKHQIEEGKSLNYSSQL